MASGSCTGLRTKPSNPVPACRSRFWNARWRRWWLAVWSNAARNTGARPPKGSGFSTTYSLNCCRRRGNRSCPDIRCSADERFYAQMPRDGYVNNGITAGFNPVALQRHRNTLNYNQLTQWSLFDQANGFAQNEALSAPG